MRKIVFYCGVEGDALENAYVRNAREYLAMTDEERIAALTGIIAELTHELKFVASRVTLQKSASEHQSPAQ